MVKAFIENLLTSLTRPPKPTIIPVESSRFRYKLHTRPGRAGRLIYRLNGEEVSIEHDADGYFDLWADPPIPMHAIAYLVDDDGQPLRLRYR